VIEAGLGGRLDATNVIPSRVTVLTSVGLDHTEWLGESPAEIAAEKLAVLRDHSVLVVGRTGPEVARLAEEAAERHGARLVRAPADSGPGIELRAPGPFQRRNFALARCAAEAFLGRLDEERVEAVAREIVIPGRLESISGRPPVLIDAAHNADGAAALAEALPEVAGGRPVIACIGILADKDAAAILRALGPAVARIVCTELPEAALRGAGRPGSRPWPASELAQICASIGVESEAIADPVAAFAAVRREAEARDGVALVAGSHYLLATLCDD
jgi:dihydrofolate synthase/folylpolyglutamate synthase